MPDPAFTVPRLAEIYDAVDGPRTDLDAYVEMAAEFRAASVLDVGCGTGSLALRLAATGREVVGVDPAAASLAVARAKPGADQVRWMLGDAGAAADACRVDLVTMTGNTAQVFVDDAAWAATLSAAHTALRPDGYLVFEVRDPDARAWETWTPARSRSMVDTVHGLVESWVTVTSSRLPLVSFRWTFRFLDDGSTLTSDSTLRFRSRAELATSLDHSGFVVEEIREARDRPGLELVVIARRIAGATE